MALDRVRIVLVHGAFRGAWSWDLVLPFLRDFGHDVCAIDLRGMGTGTQIRPSSPVHMEDWTSDVLDAISSAQRAVVVGHSMGGIPSAVAVSRLTSQRRLARVLLVDAPLIRDGLRAVDVSSPKPVDDANLPSGDVWLPPRPVGSSLRTANESTGMFPDGFDPDSPLTQFVNSRLCETPMQPSLDRVVLPVPISPTFVFCTQTPPMYPSVFTRAACDYAGHEYTLLDCHHDAPLLAPRAVADLIHESATSMAQEKV
jgi:pimeloyl-ACP methyl ester carboxylesterase